MSEHINPADCKPDEVYMGTVDGERLTLIRARPDQICQWVSYEEDAGFSFRPDFEVSVLVRFVESRPITRDDLPSVADLAGVSAEAPLGRGAVAILDAVVECVNNQGGLGIDMREPLEQAMRDMREMSREHEALRDERDDWREQAHSNAVERDKALTERDDAIAWGKVWRRRAVEAEEHAEKSERAWREVCEACDDAVVERDEWREQAGRNGTERDEARVWREEWRRRAIEAKRERDEWRARAETAEAVTEMPPAETAETELAALRGRLDDIIPNSDAIHDAWNGVGTGRIKVSQELGVQHLIRERVMAALSGAKNAEPDPDEVPRRLWEAGRGKGESTWDELVDRAKAGVEPWDYVDRMRRMARAGITPDPVEKLARELAAAAGADFDEQEDTGADMLTKIAAHVIEREATR